jgi:hypothetical protein
MDWLQAKKRTKGSLFASWEGWFMGAAFGDSLADMKGFSL